MEGARADIDARELSQIGLMRITATVPRLRGVTRSREQMLLTRVQSGNRLNGASSHTAPVPFVGSERVEVMPAADAAREVQRRPCCCLDTCRAAPTGYLDGGGKSITHDCSFRGDGTQAVRT